MKTIQIAFSDFWDGFDPQNNFLLSVICQRFDVEVVSFECADYLIYSSFGNRFTSFKGIRIYFTGENLVPDFNWCDYAIGFHHLSFGDRYLRLPLYVFYDQFNLLFDRRQIVAKQLLNRKFCSFVYSNSRNADPLREELFHRLSLYKQVDSGGGLLNNVGGRVSNKCDFISGYKFNIAFENSNSEGYTTEKLLEALSAQTLPIYYGNRRVEDDFNPHSFIRADQFDSIEALTEYIIYLDSNDEAYLDYFNHQPILHDTYRDYVRLLCEFLKPVFETESIESVRRVPRYGYRKHYARSHQRLQWLDDHKKIDKIVRSLSKI